jgi:hypothetical protein
MREPPTPLVMVSAYVEGRAPKSKEDSVDNLAARPRREL